jgi:iron complex outermembrane receptor protein
MGKKVGFRDVALRSTASLAIVLALVSGTTSVAQDAGVDEVIVTATKRAASLQDVGVSVTALSADTIERLNPSDSTELFQQVPSLELRANSGSTNANIFLRGIGSTGISFNLQSGVGVYADEVVLNSPVVNILQVFDLERMEVLRGPQNTLYGRNTTGGAINYISRKPVVGGDPNGYVQTTYGRFNQADLVAAYGAPLGDRAAFRAAVQYQTRDGIRENLFTDNADFDRDKFALRAQLALEPADNVAINIKGHLERVRGGNARYKTVGGFDPSNPGVVCSQPNTFGACVDSNGFQDSSDPLEISANIVDSKNDVNSGGASITADIDFEAFSVRSITAYEENSQVLNEDTDGTPASAFHFYLDNEQNQFSQEIRLTSNDDTDLKWIVGGYYFQESLEGQTGPLFSTPMGTMLVQSLAEFDNTTYSAYGEAEYDMFDSVTLKGGLRYSEDKVEGEMAALLAFESFFPGVDLDDSLIAGNPLPSFDSLADLAVVNGLASFTGGAVGGGPNRVIFVGGDTDPSAQINGTSFSNWGGKLGIDWQASDEVLAYAQWSRGFKAGRFNAAPMSIMNLDAATGRSFGDTPIREEQVDAYEVGLKTQFADNRVRLNLAAFYNDYTDQQINQFIAGEFVVLNVDSEIFGGEAELNFAPGGGFYFDAGASILSTDVKNPTGTPDIGGELVSAPDFTFNFAARREFDLSNGSLLTLGLNGNYSSSRFFDIANRSSDGSYFITNAQAAYSFGDDQQYQLSVWGKNIFDEVYFVNRYTNPVGLGSDTVLLNEPATYGVTLRMGF